MARRRHLDALAKAKTHLLQGQEQLEANMAGEILAEELHLTQQHLNEIAVNSLLMTYWAKFLGSFCIGK